jgi:hypothetical protein
MLGTERWEIGIEIKKEERTKKRKRKKTDIDRQEKNWMLVNRKMG